MLSLACKAPSLVSAAAFLSLGFSLLLVSDLVSASSVSVFFSGSSVDAMKLPAFFLSSLLVQGPSPQFPPQQTYLVILFTSKITKYLEECCESTLILTEKMLTSQTMQCLGLAVLALASPHSVSGDCLPCLSHSSRSRSEPLLTSQPLNLSYYLDDGLCLSLEQKQEIPILLGFLSFTGFLTLHCQEYSITWRGENTEKRSGAAFWRRRSSGWRSLLGGYPYPCVISSHCLQHLLAQLGLADGMKAHIHFSIYFF